MLLLQTSTINILESVQKTDVGSSLPTSSSGMIATLVNAAILVGALLLLLYLLWGAIQWLTSSGDKGNVEGARNKIVQALIGFALLVFAYTIYIFVLNLLGVNLGQGSSGGSSSGGVSSRWEGCSSQTEDQLFNDGGKGGYCTNGGAAKMRCVGPDAIDGFNYYHLEPCDCYSGEERKDVYTFVSCTGNL